MARLWGWTLNGLYAAALLVMAPAIFWTALRTRKYRQGWAAKLWGSLPSRGSDAPCVWLHAVSVGEVNLLATLIQRLEAQRPGWEFVVTTTTQSGYDLAVAKYGDRHHVAFCPFDFTWAVARALKRLRPRLLVLAELELWPNLIAAARRRGIAVAVVNGRLGDKSYRGYRRIRPIVARTLQEINLIAAQSEESAERFRQLGADPARVVVTGSLKYDGAAANRRTAKALELRRLAAIADDGPVFLAGSTQAPEEQFAIDVFRRVRRRHPRLRLILAPRHPERFDEVAQLLAASRLPWVRRTSLDSRSLENIRSEDRRLAGEGRGVPSPDAAPDGPAILLVDTIGELGAWWASATVGFVGGSFGNRGGQNMIEPAAYGVATCFGPNTWNFRDIVAQLLAADAACQVADFEALERFVGRALDDPAWASELGRRSREFVARQQGSTLRTIELLSQPASLEKGRFSGVERYVGRRCASPRLR